MKSLGLIGPEQTPFYVKKTKLGAPFKKLNIYIQLYFAQVSADLKIVHHRLV